MCCFLHRLRANHKHWMTCCLIILNSIILISGIAAITVGITSGNILQPQVERIAFQNPPRPYIYANNIFIGSGILMLATAIIGYYATLRGHICGLVLHSLLLTILVALLVLSATFNFFFERNAESVVENNLEEKMTRNSKWDSDYQWMERFFKCCGVQGYYGYIALKQRLRPSCCKTKNSGDYPCQSGELRDNTYLIGCFTPVIERVRDKSIRAAFIAIMMAIPLVFATLLSCILIRLLVDSKCQCRRQ